MVRAAQKQSKTPKVGNGALLVLLLVLACAVAYVKCYGKPRYDNPYQLRDQLEEPKPKTKYVLI